MDPKKFDVSGWVTKNDVRCSDGRTIRRDAFLADDGKKVPMLWHHMHSDPMNVLGHVYLENRPEGVYGYAKFNKTEKGKHAKEMVRNEDLNSFSIFATKLKHNGNDVISGEIQEVSLVLVGANAEAKIDNASFRHSDDSTSYSDDEVIVQFGESLAHAEETLDDEVETPEVTDETPPEEGGEAEVTEEGDEDPESTDEQLEHSDLSEDPTVGEVYESFSDIQKDVVNAMIYQAAGGSPTVQHSDQQGGHEMSNVFEQQGPATVPSNILSHAEFQVLLQNTIQAKGSFKQAIQSNETVLAHAQTYGITNIDYLFPEAKALASEPTMYGREMGWVENVMNGVHRTPFSRIKSMYADITAEEARALGYTKGKEKKEEVFGLLKRTTSPTTIYKKQKLDRDDILDIVDINVVMFMKAEMRLMLREETARAILLSDGRSAGSDDKIKDPAGSNDGVGIRSIYNDDNMYAHRVISETAFDPETFIDTVIRARREYRGKGQPTLFMGIDRLTDLLLLKDKIGRYLYETRASLASKLGVSNIVEVGLIDSVKRTDDADMELALTAIMVDLKDYTVGADKGGEVTLFEDFDIDFNQQKYLLETRISGALKDPKTALIFEHNAAADAVEPEPEPQG